MAMVTMTAEPTLSVVATGALATAVSVDGGPSEMDLFVAALDADGAVLALSRALATGATLVFCVGATPAWHDSPMTGVALGERGFEIIPKLASAAPSESPAKRKRVDLAEDERDENDGDVAPNPPSTKKARAVAKCSSCADFSLYTPAKWRIGSKAHNRPCPLRAVEEVPATSTLKSAPAERDRYANAGACSKASNTAEFRGSQLRLGF